MVHASLTASPRRPSPLASPHRRSRSPLQVCSTALVGPAPVRQGRGKSRASHGSKMWDLMQLAKEDSEYFDEWHGLEAGDRQRYKVRWEAAFQDMENRTMSSRLSVCYDWISFCKDNGCTRPFKPPPHVLADYLESVKFRGPTVSSSRLAALTWINSQLCTAIPIMSKL
eukprot:7125998-Karenia_brevis.AAC.1